VTNGRESIGFAALKTLIENAQQRPLEKERTETIESFEWRALSVRLPLTERPPFMSKESSAPVFLVAICRATGVVADQRTTVPPQA
jgi:hypothetical protein